MAKYTDIRKIIRVNFPKAKIISIKAFPEGYNNIVYDIGLDSGNYIIKLLKIKGFEKYVLKQKRIRTLIRKKYKKFPIPKIIKSDFSKKVIDESYIIAEKVEGKSLQNQYDKVKNKEELFEEIGELYGKLHSLKLKSYGELDSSLNLIKKYQNYYSIKCGEVKKIFEKIEKRKLLSKETLKLNINFFNKNKLLLKKELDPCMCHGDASTANIIVDKYDDEYKVKGLIDFEFARAKGPIQELFSGLRGFEKKYDYRYSLVKGYSKYGKLPKEWEKLILLYGWMGHLNQLTQIKKIKWRDLNDANTSIRKKNLRKKSILKLKEIIKVFDKKDLL
jgi:Ser/Thr protein kinase RdoA (MazF antagonist)